MAPKGLRHGNGYSTDTPVLGVRVEFSHESCSLDSLSTLPATTPHDAQARQLHLYCPCGALGLPDRRLQSLESLKSSNGTELRWFLAPDRPAGSWQSPLSIPGGWPTHQRSTGDRHGKEPVRSPGLADPGELTSPPSARDPHRRALATPRSVSPCRVRIEGRLWMVLSALPLDFRGVRWDPSASLRGA